MGKRMFVSNGFIRMGAQAAQVLPGWASGHPGLAITDLAELAVIEAFLDACTVDTAFERFAQAVSRPPLAGAQIPGDISVVSLDKGELVVQTPLGWTMLTAESRATCQVLLAIAGATGWTGRLAATRESFDAAFGRAIADGVVAPASGNLDWGDLKRHFPICSFWGSRRGTVIDRYYLSAFRNLIREHVVGDTVELGGNSGNRQLYDFFKATSYRGVDLVAGPGVDLIGDAHDPSLLPASSIDSILAFNILEHCKAPARVVENMHAWLRPGGMAFVMVPAAQRVHRYPADYVRFMPDGLLALFDGFAERQVHTYGTLPATLAAFLGIAAEELDTGDLENHHPDYPVAVCVSARR